MNILFINSDASMHEEFNEFSDEIHANNFYSDSTEESISVLNEQQIDTVIIKMGKISDASVLKYINDYYKNIKVLISARKDFEEALTIFNQIHFERINNPMGLADLRGHLAH
jgi:DNA-binding NtrC family response regulator